jgi:myo-inositol-1(or 4)-monophosphatase
MFEKANEIIREAGNIGLRFAKDGAKNWSKSDNSPVTEADLAIDSYLKTHLMALQPDFGWLSEETTDNSSRLTKKHVWIVDPIDGTRAFIRGQSDWCVSVGLVEDGVPLYGALFRPTTGDFYAASRGGGAFLNGAKLAITPCPLNGAKAAGPKPIMDKYLAHNFENVPRLSSLALRFALVAENKANLAFATSSAHEWDIAGVDMILREAGGNIFNTRNEIVRYNAPSPKQTQLVATTPSLFKSLTNH